jgi:branched-chain amino acid transport system permease protein
VSRLARGHEALRMPALLMAIIVVATLVGMQGSAGTQTAVVNALINLVLVVGLYVFVGTSGVFSFGQMSFMALGGYLAAWLTLPGELKELLLPGLPGVLQDASLSPVAAVLAAAAAGALAAVVTAAPLMRLSGLGAALATFALLGIVYTVTANLDSWTRGSSGLSGVPVTSTPKIVVPSWTWRSSS